MKTYNAVSVIEYLNRSNLTPLMKHGDTFNTFEIVKEGKTIITLVDNSIYTDGQFTTDEIMIDQVYWLYRNTESFHNGDYTMMDYIEDNDNGYIDADQLNADYEAHKRSYELMKPHWDYTILEELFKDY